MGAAFLPPKDPFLPQPRPWSSLEPRTRGAGRRSGLECDAANATAPSQTAMPPPVARAVRIAVVPGSFADDRCAPLPAVGLRVQARMVASFHVLMHPADSHGRASARAHECSFPDRGEDGPAIPTAWGRAFEPRLTTLEADVTSAFSHVTSPRSVRRQASTAVLPDLVATGADRCRGRRSSGLF